jgi:HEAT repeat protein
MTLSKHPKRKGMTAGELIALREKDPIYQAYFQENEKKRLAEVAANRKELVPLLTELAAAGFVVSHPQELVIEFPQKEVIPILLKWLPKLNRPDARESVVRALSVPWAKPLAVKPLIAEFRNTPDNLPGLKWAIGNALEVLASDDVFDEIVELVRDKKHGKDREMLAMALGKMKNPKAVDVLIGLLDDDEVVGHAIIGLNKLKAIQARPRIEQLVNHPKAWVRKEAKQTLRKFVN